MQHAVAHYWVAATNGSGAACISVARPSPLALVSWYVGLGGWAVGWKGEYWGKEGEDCGRNLGHQELCWCGQVIVSYQYSILPAPAVPPGVYSDLCQPNCLCTLRVESYACLLRI